MARLRDEAMVKKLFSTIAERYQTREGGYTRVLKAGFRYGDMAPVAIIELVDRDPTAKGQDSGYVASEHETETNPDTGEVTKKARAPSIEKHHGDKGGGPKPKTPKGGGQGTSAPRRQSSRSSSKSG
jgi:hypothetical protein